MSVLCTNCYQPVDQGSLSPGETHAWCVHCQQVFRVPLFYVPEWMLGVILILLIHLRVNF